MAYGGTIRAQDVASFLILDRRMPRSISFCIGKIADNLEYIASDYGFRPASLETARELADAAQSTPIEAIFAAGLHEYLQDTLTRFSGLGRQIERDFRFYE
jgi:uncharacterized alpha-E superfamily protein